MLHGHLVNWPDEKVRPLMGAFEELILEQRVFQEVFGVIWAENEGIAEPRGGFDEPAGIALAPACGEGTYGLLELGERTRQPSAPALRPPRMW